MGAMSSGSDNSHC